MSTQAFGSRRVTRSLSELSQYLEEAVKVAGGVRPGQVSRLDLEAAPLSLSPSITGVVWKDTGTKVLPLPTARTVTQLLVMGHDLHDTTVFKIVNAAGASYEAGKDDIVENKAGFTAEITLANPPAGVYHAYATNSAGQPSILAEACTIEVSPSAPATQSEPGLQLGALVPAAVSEGRPVYVILVVLQGKPTRYTVTALDGTAQVGWSIAEVTPKEFSAANVMTEAEYQAYCADLRKLSPGAELVLLRITAPADSFKASYSAAGWTRAIGHHILRFVAASENPKAHDALALFLYPESQAARS